MDCMEDSTGTVDGTVDDAFSRKTTEYSGTFWAAIRSFLYFFCFE